MVERVCEKLQDTYYEKIYYITTQIYGVVLKTGSSQDQSCLSIPNGKYIQTFPHQFSYFGYFI